MAQIITARLKDPMTPRPNVVQHTSTATSSAAERLSSDCDRPLTCPNDRERPRRQEFASRGQGLNPLRSTQLRGRLRSRDEAFVDLCAERVEQ